MTRLPDDERLERIFDNLKKYARHRAPTDIDPRPTLDELEAQLVSLTDRARTPGPEIDGYGACHGSPGVGGQATVLVTDEWGQQHAVPVTRVEATMFRLLDDTTVTDVVRNVAEKAYVDLLQIEASYAHLRAKLDLARRLSSPLSRSEKAGAGQCQACERDVTGSAIDRLRSGYCGACYMAWLRQGRPDRAQFAKSRRKVQRPDDGNGDAAAA